MVLRRYAVKYVNENSTMPKSIMDICEYIPKAILGCVVCSNSLYYKLIPLKAIDSCRIIGSDSAVPIELLTFMSGGNH